MHTTPKQVAVPMPTNEECVRIVESLIQRDIEVAMWKILRKYERMLERDASMFER